MEVTRFDVNALIAEVGELYAASREAARDQALARSRTCRRLEADAGRLRQILHNLLRNALEATEHQADAAVEISTRRIAGGRRAISSRSRSSTTARGSSRDIVHQAFDPYVTSKPKGTGLGLAIVKKLVEEHGGQIVARNREQGGAEISILMPISVDAGGHSVGRRHDHRRERA